MKRDRINAIKKFHSLECDVWKCYRDLFHDYSNKCSTKLKESSYFDETQLVELTQNIKESKKILVDYCNENKELIDEYKKIKDMIENHKDHLNTDEIIYIINSEFVINSYIARDILFGTLMPNQWKVDILLFDRVLHSFYIKSGSTQVEDAIIKKFKKNEYINRYR